MDNYILYRNIGFDAYCVNYQHYKPAKGDKKTMKSKDTATLQDLKDSTADLNNLPLKTTGVIQQI